MTTHTSPGPGADERPPTFGLVLAGGLARRMGGGDKPLIRVGDRTILDRVVSILNPQCAGVAINANGDPVRFAVHGLPVVADDVAGFAGPLAGILAGLEFVASRHPQIDWVVSSPGDCPFLPADLVARLHAIRRAAKVRLACARSGEWRHPTVGLWPVDLRGDLRRAVVDEGVRRIETFTQRHGIAVADWPAAPLDPFFNVNTPDDAAAANRLAASAS